jgi:hypothetical protein
VIWKRDMLVDTCAQGGMVGRLAKRRLVLNQPVQKVERHDANTDGIVRAVYEPYIVKSYVYVTKVSMSPLPDKYFGG